jgi:hypothetical protein
MNSSSYQQNVINLQNVINQQTKSVIQNHSRGFDNLLVRQQNSRILRFYILQGRPALKTHSELTPRRTVTPSLLDMHFNNPTSMPCLSNNLPFPS